MNIVYLGNTTFSSNILEQIYKDNVHKICLIITSIDKKLDRKKKLVLNPLAKFSQINKIPLLQTNNINDEISKITKYNPDFLLTCAFGQYLNEKFLNNFDVYNIHPSLLPKLRGGAPINWAIVNDLNETGVTLLQSNKYLDKGDIIFQKKIKIQFEDDFYLLESKLLKLINSNITNWLTFLIKSKKIPHIKQNDLEASYGFNINSKDLIINWNMNARKIYKQIQGFKNIGCRSKINNVGIKILDCKIIKKYLNKKIKPGEIIDLTCNDFIVGTADDYISIKLFIFDNCKLMTPKMFYNGNKIIKIGDIFNAQ